MLSDRTRARITIITPDAGVRLAGRLQAWLHARSGGRVGGRFGRGPLLVLRTTGRRSGKPRETVVIYGQDGGRFVVIGSNTGSEHAPAWALNLVANPDADVLVRGRRTRVRARVESGRERERLWQLMNRDYGGFDLYRSRTDRDIKLFVLEPV